MASLAGFAQHVLEALPRTLTCHFHQPQRRHFAHLRFGMILVEIFLQRIQNLAFVIVTFHIDEVDNNNSAQVT